MSPTITVESSHRPAKVISTAEARVRVTGRAPAYRVLDAGLAALHESKNRLFGWGVRGSDGRILKDLDPIVNETVTVFAVRD